MFQNFSLHHQSLRYSDLLVADVLAGVVLVLAVLFEHVETLFLLLIVGLGDVERLLGVLAFVVGGAVAEGSGFLVGHVAVVVVAIS